MPKRAPKSQLMTPFRAALDAGYAHLRKMEQLKYRIQTLDSPSFENVKVLNQLGMELLEDLTDSMQRSAKILELAKHWEQLADVAPEPVIPREILDHISIQLLLYHLGDSTTSNASSLKKQVAIDPARQRYEIEIENFISLIKELWDHKVNVTRILALTISDHRIHLAQHWQDWMETHELLRKKAVRYKRRYISLKNELSGLFSTDLETLLLEECNQACDLIDRAIDARFVKEHDRIYRHSVSLRRNSKVWSPILKSLEELLAQHYELVYVWDNPTRTGGTLKPTKIYNLINRILHYCHPQIWPHNPKTTKSIQSRCQR